MGIDPVIKVFIRKEKRWQWYPEFTLGSALIVRRREARKTVRAMTMLLNFARVIKRGGGGRVATEYNDGFQWFYANRNYKIGVSGGYFHIPAFTGIGAAEFRRIRKCLGTVIDY